MLIIYIQQLLLKHLLLWWIYFTVELLHLLKKKYFYIFCIFALSLVLHLWITGHISDLFRDTKGINQWSELKWNVYIQMKTNTNVYIYVFFHMLKIHSILRGQPKLGFKCFLSCCILMGILSLLKMKPLNENLLQSCPCLHLCTHQVWRWHPEQETSTPQRSSPPPRPPQAATTGWAEPPHRTSSLG